MADKTLIQLNRFNRGGADSFANGYELKDGEPIFDLRTNRFYIGTSINNTGNSIAPTVQNLYVNGQYFVPINDKKPIPTSYISDSAITTAKINNKAVTNEKIADGAVTNNKLTLSEYGINLDRINIPDKSIPFDKISGYVPYDRISGKPTKTDASTIEGKIKWENLPALEFTNNTMELNGVTYGAALCAVHAYKDQQGSVIHKKYGSQLAVNTSASELQLKSPDNTTLSTISGKELAQIVGYNGEGVTFNGRIDWKNIDGKPTMLDMSGVIGSGTIPIYYDADRKQFCECMSYMELLRQIPRYDSVKTVGSADRYVNVLSDYVNVSGEYLIAYQIKTKNSSGGVYWNTGTGYFNTSWKTAQYFAWQSNYYSLYIEPTPEQFKDNGPFRIVGNTYVGSGYQLAQIKYRLMKLQ